MRPPCAACAALARTAPVRPAAVCIWARWIPVALEALQGTGTPVCAVANFPNGASGHCRRVGGDGRGGRRGGDRGGRRFSVPGAARGRFARGPATGSRLPRGLRTARAAQSHFGNRTTGQRRTYPPSGGHRHRRRRALSEDLHGQNSTRRDARSGSDPAGCDRGGGPAESSASASRLPAVSARFEDALGYLTLYELRFGTGSASASNFRIGASGLFKELAAAALD